MTTPTPEQIADHMRELVVEADLSRDEIKLLLLATAIERVDAFLIWLDRHVASEHGDDDGAPLVRETINTVRAKLHRELDVAQAAADLVLS